MPGMGEAPGSEGRSGVSSPDHREGQKERTREVTAGLMIQALLDAGRPPGTVPPLWDGHAAERVVDVLERVV